MRHSMIRKKNKLNKLPVGFVLFCMIPACVLVLSFYIIPTVQAILLSFQKVGALSMEGQWIGLDNYRYLITDDSFIEAFGNTIKIILVTPLCTIATAFFLAFVLQTVKLREKQMYVTIFYLPSIISSSVLAVIWAYVFHPTSGLLNTLLDVIGLETWKHTWLGDKKTALWCIAVVIFLSCFGYYMILHMVGMAEISPEIYESAEIDGAGFWTKFKAITFPLMKNLIITNTILCMSGVLGASFAYTKLLTNGGPNGASAVLMSYAFKQGMENGNMGYSSAISVVTIIFAFVLSSISQKMSNKED